MLLGSFEPVYDEMEDDDDDDKLSNLMLPGSQSAQYFSDSDQEYRFPASLSRSQTMQAQSTSHNDRPEAGPLHRYFNSS